MFRVGQKVVRFSGGPGCVITNNLTTSDYTFPALGDVVTVRTVNDWPSGTLLTFYEHDNSHLIARLGSRYEPGFKARYFRPLVERKTDISIFTAMLTPKRKHARVPS